MDLSLLVLIGQLGVAPLSAPGSPAGLAPSQTSDAPLTLSAAVARAAVSSSRLRAAVLAAEGVRDAVPLAGRPPNPLFELRTENWTSSSQPSAPDLDVFAVLTQPIELGDKRGARQRLASAERDIAETTLKSVERDVALDTVRAYVRVLKARALVDTLSANRAGLTTLVAGVGRRVEEGYTAEADLLKFKTEAARVDGDIAWARLDLERSLAALTIAIGEGAPVRAVQLVEPPPVPLPAADAGVLALSVARHPQVLRAAATIDRARQVTLSERARRWPDALVTGGYKRTAGFDTAVLGVALALPIFERYDASVARAAGLERAAAADRDALVLQLTQEAGALVRAAQTITDQSNRTPQELLAPAEEVRRAALAAFREGAADVMKLIDAERVYADVQRAAIELRLDALLITIEARFALGEEPIP